MRYVLMSPEPGTAGNLSNNGSVEEDCKAVLENREVRGESLAGVVENGAGVVVEKDYYRCNGELPKRDEVVAYSLAGRPDPIIKQIRAVPGDRFELRQSGDEKWQIAVNGKILKTSEGEEYEIGLSGWKMLSLYEKDYKGVVPEGAYLILGNQPGGTLDSTKFGLVSIKDFYGRVQI